MATLLPLVYTTVSYLFMLLLL